MACLRCWRWMGNRKTRRKPDELLTSVMVPRELEDAASTFVKLGARRYLVISISMVAAVVQVRDRRILEARIAVGSCSAVARRHLAPLSPIDDVRATAEYRMDASLRLVQRALNSCVENG